MSFFNLTQLGPSDPFSSAREKSSSSQPASDGADHMITQPKTINPPPSLSAPCPSFVREMYGEETDHKEITSHKEFTNRRIKHQRSDKGPMDIYKQPITTSHDYGWWIKDGGHAPDWAHTDRHAHVNSEMTRYVDEMSLTNKDFSLF